mmetsp:Transcript_128593/g.191597  ORF Transcript_128593/g.191597 Transcript_128593/m.191597 type:complete len:106 (-) Transcript_128593:425-742(-)|eukprot:CAMPEP_0117053318 /NCGR_PEP_ID=MMETSP0472-20121206/36862_1 /TAXON_ID=693140 ORGANISM="Tiarina fusus, Strain LIS" /NCGR_SAMPLE_ID=MMETSP0472 /ASSEMBLY_ACC=CAM_ASM_000603 /LENGTH=105 /DNA_ID=CAMNT_0004768295 /DNA_START=250 /DNA_END=567 /DNA_ORIENTATION=+
MTIYDDDKKVEDIRLYDLKTKDDMHGLMTEKGFSKKDATQITKDRRIRQADKDIQQQNAAKPMYSFILQMYGAIGIVTLVFAFLINSRKKKKQPRPVGRAILGQV